MVSHTYEGEHVTLNKRCHATADACNAMQGVHAGRVETDL